MKRNVIFCEDILPPECLNLLIKLSLEIFKRAPHSRHILIGEVEFRYYRDGKQTLKGSYSTLLWHY